MPDRSDSGTTTRVSNACVGCCATWNAPRLASLRQRRVTMSRWENHRQLRRLHIPMKRTAQAHRHTSSGWNVSSTTGVGRHGGVFRHGGRGAGERDARVGGVAQRLPETRRPDASTTRLANGLTSSGTRLTFPAPLTATRANSRPSIRRATSQVRAGLDSGPSALGLRRLASCGSTTLTDREGAQRKDSLVRG